MFIADLYQVYISSEGVYIDSSDPVEGGIFFAIRGENFDGNDFVDQALESGAACCVVDRQDLKSTKGCIYVPNTLTALQRLARHHRDQLDIPVLALTGSNGKTTTKELVQAVLSQQYSVSATKGNLNNHLGVPLTVLQIGKDTEIAIVEMGANHLGEIKWLCQIANPTLGLITNIGDAHLEGFGSLGNIRQAKTELYRYLDTAEGIILINADEPSLAGMDSTFSKCYTYSKEKILQDDMYLRYRESDLFQEFELIDQKSRITIQSHLYGRHNRQNLLTAVAVGSHFQVGREKIKKGIESYIPGNNRSQVLQIRGFTFYMDAYNANPTSMKHALSFFRRLEGKDKVVVLGDMKELGPYSRDKHLEIVNLLIDAGEFKHIILVGPVFLDVMEYVGTTSNIVAKVDVDETIHWWKNIDPTPCQVLVKGSRSMRLENLVGVIAEKS